MGHQVSQHSAYQLRPSHSARRTKRVDRVFNGCRGGHKQGGHSDNATEWRYLSASARASQWAGWLINASRLDLLTDRGAHKIGRRASSPGPCHVRSRCWCSRCGSHAAVQREAGGCAVHSKANLRCPRNGKWTSPRAPRRSQPLSVLNTRLGRRRRYSTSPDTGQQSSCACARSRNVHEPSGKTGRAAS
jgi:hypothetical protein